MAFLLCCFFFFFFSSRRRHTRFDCDWSSDVCSSDLLPRGVSLPLSARRRARSLAVCALFRASDRWPTPHRHGRSLPRTRLFRNALSDRKSTRLNSSHSQISYAVFCLKKKTTIIDTCL